VGAGYKGSQPSLQASIRKINMDKNIATTIDGVGFVEEKNDLAAFTLTIKSKGETLDLATSQVKEKTNHFLDDLAKIDPKMDMEPSTTLQTFKLEHREGTEKYAAGFQAINTISWIMFVDDKLDDVYQMCLKTDSSTPVPTFSFKDKTKLQEQAIQKAADNVKEKLNKECMLLGITADKLKVYNWNFGYEGYLPMNKNFVINNGYISGAVPTGPQGSQGVNGVFSNASNFVPLPQKLGSIYQELLNFKLKPGTSSVKIPMQVNYIWNE